MKIVRRLEEPAPGLVAYFDCVGDDTNWDESRSHESEGIDDPETMDAWVRAVLMPDEDGNLTSFFATARCYFHPIGERILAEDPHAWI